jgi:CheY-like chemotaxis protein
MSRVGRDDIVRVVSFEASDVKERLMSARILVINNDSLTREVLVICLSDAGWEVLSYAYDDIDLTLLKHLHPDLIILNFTRQNGGAEWQFLQMLKMDDTTAIIPILVTTTVFPLAHEMQRYLLTRYIHIVYQPFDLDMLLGLVQKTFTLANQADLISSRDRGLPILVVDDSEDLREGLATILMLEGYQVVTASNGLLALDAVYHMEHCLILLDIEMPIMDGLEFLKIYSRQLRPHTSVIILSAKADLRDITFPPFVVDVLAKPYDISHLVTLAEKHTLL